MRPGQETPDEAPLTAIVPPDREAPSMRPGQETPDEVLTLVLLVLVVLEPSMRPGQETPDEEVSLDCSNCSRPSFNEAGARNPG